VIIRIRELVRIGFGIRGLAPDAIELWVMTTAQRPSPIGCPSAPATVPNPGAPFVGERNKETPSGRKMCEVWRYKVEGYCMIWRQKINQGMEAVEKAREQGGKYTYDADRAFSEAFEIARNMKDCEGMVSAGLGFNSLADLQGGGLHA